MKIKLDNKVTELQERYEKALIKRICPVCFEAGKIVTTGHKQHTYTIDFKAKCFNCSEEFGLYDMNSEGEEPRLLLSLDKKWLSCMKCHVRYTREEQILKKEVPGSESCPGCGYRYFYKEKEPKPYMEEELYTKCHKCSSRIESVRFSHYTEFRDGMMGDYTRTTDKWMRFCPTCDRYSFLITEENTKFAPVTKIEAFMEFPAKYAERLILCYDENLGHIKSRAS